MTITRQSQPSNDKPARVDVFEAQGINPYPHSYERSCALIDVHQDYGYADGDGEETTLRLMGRVVGIRAVGRNVYVRLEDRDSSLQFFLSVNHMSHYEIVQFTQLVERGDWVGFLVDRLYRTTDMDLTALVQQWTMLAPVVESLMPDTTAAVAAHADSAVRLAGDRQARRRFIMYSKTLRMLRRTLEDDYGYLEVKTPPSIPAVQTGRVGQTFWNRSTGSRQNGFCPNRDAQAYLADRLIGGLDAVYDIVTVPSNAMGETNTMEDRSPSDADHILQCALAPADINDMMSLVERLVTDVADVVRDVAVATPATDRGAPFESMALQLGLHWRRRSLIALVQVETGYDFTTVESVQQAVEIAGAVSVYARDCDTVGAVAVRIAEQLVYPQLREPTFLVDYPYTEFPQAKPDRHLLALAEMARLFVNGADFGMVYTVENDPRHPGLGRVTPVSARTPGLLPASEMSYGLPPAGMLCIHIDHLLALLGG
ncbi:MAG: hypothetical protein IPK19_06660 [Chloroflexi bacterium]|nr:hypothetical protein [Chloroflexota bacterium]